jgi:hypothetical protein
MDSYIETVRAEIKKDFDKNLEDAVNQILEDTRIKIEALKHARLNEIEEQREAELQLKRDAEEALRLRMESDEPLFEVIDYTKPIDNVENYRYNRAFIIKIGQDFGIVEDSHYKAVNTYLKRIETDKRREILDAERQKHLDSKQPWFNWTQVDSDSEGYSINLEWNDAHIKHLKELGFTGSDEEELVRLWLSNMVRSASTNMDYEGVTNE